MLLTVDQFFEFEFDLIARVRLLPILENLLEVFLVGLGSDSPETCRGKFIFLLQLGACSHNLCIGSFQCFQRGCLGVGCPATLTHLGRVLCPARLVTGWNKLAP